MREEGRLIAVLSDGLGSGVKASVLANLTATMALKYTESFADVRQSAETIMDTLPVCEVRRISYSTFTIIDVEADGSTRVIEHGNPELLLLRGGSEVPIERSSIQLERWKDRTLQYAAFRMKLDDRLVACSDGVTQSGLGRPGLPLGWGRQSASAFLRRFIAGQPDASAASIARAVVDESRENDFGDAKDDITAGVVHFRCPRRLLIATGPPFDRARDGELAELIQSYPGRKAICGGTTANIIERLLDRPITMDLTNLDEEIPPRSLMEGVDLITEGTLTLARVAELLEQPSLPSQAPPRPNAAEELFWLMLGSDVIEFAVGTRINQAHQDPNVPVELDLRRNLIRRICGLLETRLLKQVAMRLM